VTQREQLWLLSSRGRKASSIEGVEACRLYQFHDALHDSADGTSTDPCTGYGVEWSQTSNFQVRQTPHTCSEFVRMNDLQMQPPINDRSRAILRCLFAPT
jgi:hypothetical protein